ncbi:MAG: hypothetical protein R3F61_11405 [Myxococcota bacterium]
MEDDRTFTFSHPWFRPMRTATWTLAGLWLLASFGAVAMGLSALAAGLWGAAAVTVFLGNRASTVFAPVEVRVTRHRIRIDHDGTNHGDLLIEGLTGATIHDVVLYVLRAGHHGNGTELAEVLRARMEATRDGQPLPDDVRRQLARLASGTGLSP